MPYTKNAEHLIKQVLIPLHHKIKENDTVNGTVEIINANLVFDATDTKLNLGEARKAQHKYIENELAWYLSQDRCIKGHPGIEDNKIWSKICTDEGRVNSNYGFLLFSKENGNGEFSQYEYALKAIIKDKNTRQAIMYFCRPQLHWEYCDNINARYDFTCTISYQIFIRNNILCLIVTMRSNDVIRGLQCGDLPFAGYIYEKIYNELLQYYPELKYGEIMWNAASLHCYERDFILLDKIVEEYYNS